jgi:hypothetical protein
VRRAGDREQGIDEGTGVEICGFPPIAHRTRNGWGTQRI